MSDYNSLKAAINANIRKNGRQEITGQVLNGILRAMVDALGAGFTFRAVASPDTDPGSTDSRVFYIATVPGNYEHMGGIEIEEGEVAILKFYDDEWHKEPTGLASQAALESLGDTLGAAIGEKMTFCELWCDGDKITRKDSQIALSFAEVKELMDDPSQFVALKYIDVFWMLPQYDDEGGAIIFTGVSLMSAQGDLWRVAINEEDQISDYSIAIENQYLKTNDLGDEQRDNFKTYPTTQAVNAALNDKVNKVPGKGLSSNDFTTQEKNKLAGLNNYDDTELRSQVQSGVTDASRSAAQAAASAASAESKYAGILQAMENLPDGSAVSAQVALNTQKLTALEAFKEIAKKQITTTQELKDTLVLNVGSFYGTGTNVTLKLDDTQYRYSDPFTMQKGDRFSAHEVNTHPFSRALIVSVNEDGTYTKLLYVRESVNDWEYIEESESRLVSVCFRYNANNTYSFIRTIKGYLEDIIDNEINVRNANESKGKLLNNPFVKSFAHQGYSPNGNRITSFYNAYLKGADVFLCNQVWTSDTKAVCAHEGTITMTNISTGESESVVIGEHTLEDLQSNYLYYGEKIASLEDVLYLAKCTGKMVFMVNVSNINSTKRNYIKSLVAKYGMRDKVIWGLSSSYSTLIQEAEIICNWYNYSHISILSSTFSSVSTDAIAEIESNIGKALQIATEYNHVMLWVNAGFPEEKYAEWNDMISNPSYWSEEIGAKCAIARIGIGCFDNRTIAEGQARTYDNIMKILPYISYVSSYDKSYKDMISKIEAGLKEKFLIMG